VPSYCSVEVTSSTLVSSIGNDARVVCTEANEKLAHGLHLAKGQRKPRPLRPLEAPAAVARGIRASRNGSGLAGETQGRYSYDTTAGPPWECVTCPLMLGPIIVAIPKYKKGKLALVPKKRDGTSLTSKVEAPGMPREDTGYLLPTPGTTVVKSVARVWASRSDSRSKSGRRSWITCRSLDLTRTSAPSSCRETRGR
jgi:hypothetical protein